MTNKMQMCSIIYYSLAALRVSSDIFAHHQEHLNCITAASWQRHTCLIPEARQSAQKGGKAVSPTHRPPLPPGNIPGTHFC